MSNKQLEYECIERIRAASNGFTRRKKEIVDILFSEDVSRKDNERPDFIKKCYVDGKDRFVGVEHFSVDQFNHIAEKDKENNNPKIQGTSIFQNKNRKEIFEKYHNIAWTNDEYISAAKDIAKIIANDFTNKNDFTYQIFIDAFRKHLNTHLKNVSEYNKNIIESGSTNSDNRLCFLIDFLIDFDTYYFVKNNKFNACNHKIIPLFEDIVVELEILYKNGIDYLILCFTDINANKTRVIPLDTKNIRQQLKKYNITIYRYVGQDMFLKDYNSLQSNPKTTFRLTELIDRINVDFTYERKPVMDFQAKQMGLNACCIAYYYRKGEINFIMDAQTAMFLYVFYDMMSGWDINHDKVAFIIPKIKHFDIKRVKEREQKFKNSILNGEANNV